MEIYLNENWRVTADRYQYFLEKKNIVQDKESVNFGNAYWVFEGSHPTIESVFKGYLDKKIRDSDVKSIKELVSLVNDTRREIEGLRQELAEAVRV